MWLEACRLQKLNLQGTRVTDAGLAHLARMPRLEFLDLRDTQVTDAGLAHLSALERLRSLRLGQTKVTTSGIEALQKALPHLEVQRETVGEVLWSAFEGLLAITGLLPLADPEELARALAVDPGIVDRPVNDYTTDCPLHLAAAQGKREIVELLLRESADVNLAGERGRTRYITRLPREICRSSKFWSIGAPLWR